jgi:hypothetical protein
MSWSHFRYYAVISLEVLSKAAVILRQNSGSLSDSAYEAERLTNSPSSPAVILYCVRKEGKKVR